jgi:hypothetical protein
MSQLAMELRQEQRIATLEAEVAELRKDAERFDALETLLLQGADVFAYINYICIDQGMKTTKATTLREAIDEVKEAQS